MIISKLPGRDVVNRAEMVADAERRMEQAERAIDAVGVGHGARIVTDGVDYALHLSRDEARAALVPMVRRLREIRDLRKADFERYGNGPRTDKPAE